MPLGLRHSEPAARAESGPGRHGPAFLPGRRPPGTPGLGPGPPPAPRLLREAGNPSRLHAAQAPTSPIQVPIPGISWSQAVHARPGLC